MSASELLRLVIQADTQGAVKGLEAVGSAADKGLGKAESRADKLAGNLQKFGAVAVSAGAVAATGLFKAGQAASDLGESVSQSEQIFGEAAAGIGDFAKGAAGSLGQSERAAREAANTFGLFFTNAGKSKQEAAGMSTELAKLASDMASFKNTSPEQAVEALGAALRGESEPIRAYGVMLDDATLKQRAMDMGLTQTTTGTLPPAIKMQAAYAEILAQTGTIQGDFERTSGGLANQQRILAAEFENAKAAIGQGALPVLTKITGIAADAASGFASLDQATGGAVGTFATMATGALLVGGGLAIAVGQAIKMRDSLSTLKPLIMNAEGGLNKLGKAGALVGIAAGLYGIGKMIEGATELKINLDDLTVALGKNDAATQRQVQGMAQALSSFGKLDNTVKDLASTNVVAAERMVDAAAAAGIEGEELEKLRGIVDGKKAAEVQATKDTQDHAAAMAEAVPAAEAFGGAQENAADKVERLQKELHDATDAITENYSAMNEALGLAVDYEASIDDMVQSLKDNGRTLDVTTEKGRANVQQMMETGESIAALIQKRYEETGSTKTAAAAGDLYVENLRNQLREAGFTEGAIADLIAQMHLTPEEIRTNLLAQTESASRAISDYQRLLNNTPRYIETTFNGVSVSRPNRVDRNADGTSYFGGGLTWVGERGPEIVELPRGSAVYDHQKSMAMAAAASTSAAQQIDNSRHIGQIVVQTNSPRAFVDEFLWQGAGL